MSQLKFELETHRMWRRTGCRDAETRRRGDAETRRHGDAPDVETWRRGDAETRRRGDAETHRMWRRADTPDVETRRRTGCGDAQTHRMWRRADMETRRHGEAPDVQDEVVKGHGDYAILCLKSPDKSFTTNEIIYQLRKS